MLFLAWLSLGKNAIKWRIIQMAPLFKIKHAVVASLPHLRQNHAFFLWELLLELCFFSRDELVALWEGWGRLTPTGV
jgi:hypothetical protein